MKPAATLYFIYCLIAKKWGKSVKIKRDSLHNVYSVNQYGVTVTGTGPKEIFAYLADTLSAEGYNTNYSCKTGKTFSRVHNKIETNIHLYLTKESVEVSIHAYKISKELPCN